MHTINFFASRIDADTSEENDPFGYRCKGVSSLETYVQRNQCQRFFHMRAGSLSDIAGIGIQPSQLREWIDGWQRTALRFNSLGIFYLPI